MILMERYLNKKENAPNDVHADATDTWNVALHVLKSTVSWQTHLGDALLLWRSWLRISPLMTTFCQRLVGMLLLLLLLPMLLLVREPTIWSRIC